MSRLFEVGNQNVKYVQVIKHIAYTGQYIHNSSRIWPRGLLETYLEMFYPLIFYSGLAGEGNIM